MSPQDIFSDKWHKNIHMSCVWRDTRLAIYLGCRKVKNLISFLLRYESIRTNWSINLIWVNVFRLMIHFLRSDAYHSSTKVNLMLKLPRILKRWALHYKVWKLLTFSNVWSMLLNVSFMYHVHKSCVDFTLHGELC